MAADLAPFKNEFRLAMIMDALPAHIAPNVIRACRDSGVVPIIVPPKTTGILQPLDTHVFAGVKRLLRQKYDEERIASFRGEVNMLGFLKCLRFVTDSVFAQNWSKAFNQNGFGAARDALSSALKECGCVGDARPGDAMLEDVALCLPERRQYVAASIYKFYAERHEEAESTMKFRIVRRSVHARHSAHSADSVKRLYGRTRSQTRALRRRLVFFLVE